MEQPASRIIDLAGVRTAHALSVVRWPVAGHHGQGAVSRELLALRRLRRGVERRPPNRKLASIPESLDGALLVITTPHAAGRRA
jgi:hypothetical protein